MKRFAFLLLAFVAMVLTFALFPPRAAAADLQTGYPISIQFALTNAIKLENAGVGRTNVSDRGAPLVLPGDKGFSMQVVYAGSSAVVTTNVGLIWSPSVDGTNYCTDTNAMLFTWFAPQGATATYYTTNISPLAVGPWRYLKLYWVQPGNLATNQFGTLTNVIIGAMR